MAKAKRSSKSAPLPISSLDLFDISSSAVRENLSPFVILNLLPATIMLGSAIFNSRHVGRANSFSAFGAVSGLPTYAVSTLAGVGIAIFVAVLIASLFIRVMLYGLQLQAAKSKKPDLATLWEIAKKYWLRMLGLNLVVGFLILGGLLLLVVPGLIMLRRYFLAPYVLIDKDVSISEAMRISAKISKPYSGSVWGILGVSLLLSLPSFIPFIGGIISLILAVLYSVAPALRYEELKQLVKT
jgi:uncharacterized membrane protein